MHEIFVIQTKLVKSFYTLKINVYSHPTKVFIYLSLEKFFSVILIAAHIQGFKFSVYSSSRFEISIEITFEIIN
jgi:hypothetical protein